MIVVAFAWPRLVLLPKATQRVANPRRVSRRVHAYLAGRDLWLAALRRAEVFWRSADLEMRDAESGSSRTTEERCGWRVGGCHGSGAPRRSAHTLTRCGYGRSRVL